MRVPFWAFLAVASMAALARAAEPMVVHEWGTFTSYQDESGRAIGGVNSDDERVPGFVHNSVQIIQPLPGGKGIPARDPDVTLRLETPVIYFHRGPGLPEESVDVDVSFHGGWLTEYYPDAQVPMPDLSHHLTGATTGELSWHDVRVGIVPTGPITGDKVWTTPRNVLCDGVGVGNESERFLFYRGVAHLDSPLSVARESNGRTLSITQQNLQSVGSFPEMVNMPIWLVDVREGGALAWRKIENHAAPSSTGAWAGASGEFAAGDYSPASLALLHQNMALELQRAGLFPDEAEAMLNTWELSYFRSPGTRVFFLVPQSWTDSVLPLRISGNPRITRVMVGRIELVTPRQRALVAVVRQSSADEEQWAAYARLGRFRDALLLDEEQRNPSPFLTRFLQVHAIVAYQVPQH